MSARAEAPKILSEDEENLRTQHWAVVTRHAVPSHLAVLERFHAHQFGAWAGWFPQLVPPVPRLTTPPHPRALGCYAYVAGDGLKGEIRLRPSLLDGSHPLLREGDEFLEGRIRFLEDVLLHESVHAFNREVTRDDEPSYKGHGPAFAAKCNEIGSALGLQPVRSAKKRGKDRTLPSCAHWPHNVRPKGYYLGALAEEDEKEGAEKTPDDAGGDDAILEALSGWKEAGAVFAALLEKLPPERLSEVLSQGGTVKQLAPESFGAGWTSKCENGANVSSSVFWEVPSVSANGDAPRAGETWTNGRTTVVVVRVYSLNDENDSIEYHVAGFVAHEALSLFLSRGFKRAEEGEGGRA